MVRYNYNLSTRLKFTKGNYQTIAQGLILRQLRREPTTSGKLTSLRLGTFFCTTHHARPYLILYFSLLNAEKSCSRCVYVAV